MVLTTKAETSLKFVPGTYEDARDRAAAIAAETNREIVPVRVFDQGNRTLLCGVLPVRVLTRVLEHNASTRGTAAARALNIRNRPVAADHVRAIKAYILNAIEKQENFIIPPLTLNSTDSVEIMVPEGNYTPTTGYAVFPDEASVHITDGQHRYLAIRQAVDDLRGTPNGDNFMRVGVPFMMTVESDLNQVHQDFADAGRTKPLPSSLLAVYDTRQPANRAVMELGEQVKLLKGRIDATSSTLSLNSPFVFLVNQIRQFVKTSLTGSPTVSEQSFASSAGNTLAIPESYNRWVQSRVAFLDVMTEIIDDWRELAELSQPGGADAAEVLAKTKAIREQKRVSMTAAFLNALGVVSYEVLKDATSEDVDQDKLKGDLRTTLEPFRHVDWERSSDIWEGNLVSEGRIRTQTPVIKAAAGKLLELLQN